MPVGTYGTVKSVTPEEVAADGDGGEGVVGAPREYRGPVGDPGKAWNLMSRVGGTFPSETRCASFT